MPFCGQGDLLVQGFLSHVNKAIEALAYNDGFLASGAKNEIKIWQINRGNRQFKSLSAFSLPVYAI